MGLPETLLIAFGAALIMALVFALLLRGVMHGKAITSNPAVAEATAAEFALLRSTNAELDRKLAAEEVRSSRLTEVEAKLAEAFSTLGAVRTERSAVDVELAMARQDALGAKQGEAELRSRLAEASQDLDVVVKNVEELRLAKAVSDETLATRTAEFVSATAATAELRGRLETEANRSRDLETAIATIRKEKAEADETLAARAAALESAAASITDLRQRLDISESSLRELGSRLDKLRTEKSGVDEILSAKVEALRIGDEQAVQLRAELTETADKLASATSLIADLRTAGATLKETVEQERLKADEKIALLTQARVDMGREFKALAEEVMSRHGESFTKLNKEQMDAILNPLREKLGEFEKKVQESHVESVKERATLAEQIRHIAATGTAMGKETKELTEALRGRSQMQGAWGEMVLSTVLERSGLRANEEYIVQQSFAGEDGTRLRPDVVVNMPGGQRMVVDAKVSLTAFEALVHAGTEEERDVHLQRHLASIRSHITTLGSKEYHSAAGTTLDYVVMFVPIEGALAAALQAEPNLILFAAEKNVAITTPTTLMVALRTISNVWRVERRNQNAEEIADRAGKLYEKFVGFIGDMNAIDDGIAKTRTAYDKAMNKLKSGNGNLVRQIEQLKSMGGRTSKALPSSLLEAADGQVIVALTTQVTETVETTTQLVVTAPAHEPVPEDGREAAE